MDLAADISSQDGVEHYSKIKEPITKRLEHFQKNNFDEWCSFAERVIMGAHSTIITNTISHLNSVDLLVE